MSDIIDLITKLVAGPERRIGFAQSQEQSDRQLPVIIAVADISASKEDLTGADGIARIVPSLSALKKRLDGNLGLPWGIWDSKNIDRIINKVCESKENRPDFVAFSADILSLEIMQLPDVARILRIPLSISTDSLLDISNIPADAITVRFDATAKVSLETIGRLGTMRSVIDKPLLLELPPSVSSPLLSLIKDLGVEGLVVDTSNNNFSSVGRLKELLNAIPKKEKPSGQKRPNAAIAGALSYSVNADEQEESE